MNETIYVIGHKNPDSDSICSAIAYSYFKEKLGYNAIPIRCGEINRETEFILNYFNIQPPKYLSNIKTKLSDLLLDKLYTIKPENSMNEAWTLIKQTKNQILAVVDDSEKFIGLISIHDITSAYFDINNKFILSNCKTPISNIIKTLNGNLVIGEENFVIEKGKLLVGAMTPEEMRNFIEKDDIVIVANRIDNQKEAINQGAKVLIVTGNFKIHPEIYNLAYNNNCIIITTPFDTFTTARIIPQSVPIKTLMTTDKIVSFNSDDLVEEITKYIIEKRHKVYPVLNNEQKVVGALTRYNLISYEKKKVVLLDHNEKIQAINGIEDCDIIEIIDHHKIGDIQTNHPIYLRNEPVGSTATIVTSIILSNNIVIPENIAGILCAAIISDTLKFKSPTCTETDKKLAYYLAGIAKIDIDVFSEKMFKAGSTFDGKSEEEIVFNDFKEFKIKGYKLGVSQIITMNIDTINEIKNRLTNYIENLIHKTDYDAILILITDINEESSILIYSDRDNIINNALNQPQDQKEIFLKGIVSRKKQLIPLLAKNIT